ncbi:sulfatase/phosphatase domain-containing protein [Niabella ginsengisoli]|uniref:DUF4976 domain-containing protein n=1 Tax=Niabella ginsengisoli TaxID=522298 RepID=A0ABS9SL27_9BACT|nr:sulfatase/phosphatase domain-containing protein [Niabella ginsengisoli]MCH5598986.1 DUF4976 domain-containing protein [Niabella ginsengisoli]
MMNPNKKDSYWNGWVDKAKTDTHDQKLIDRIVNHPAIEFYDIKKDPYELNNLAGDPKYKSLIKEYSSKLRMWMKQQGDTGASMDINYKKKNKE